MIFAVLRLGSVLGSILVLVAAVMIFRAVKSRAAVILMLGGILATIGLVSSFLISMFAMGLMEIETFGMLSVVAGAVLSTGWALVGLGVAMLAPVVAGMARRNRDLEEILASRD